MTHQIMEKSVQTCPAFDATLISSLNMPDLEQYESDEDYQYENTPSAIFELESKVEYNTDRLSMATTAFTEFLELEMR